MIKNTDSNFQLKFKDYFIFFALVFGWCFCKLNT